MGTLASFYLLNAIDKSGVAVSPSCTNTRRSRWLWPAGLYFRSQIHFSQ